MDKCLRQSVIDGFHKMGTQDAVCTKHSYLPWHVSKSLGIQRRSQFTCYDQISWENLEDIRLEYAMTTNCEDFSLKSSRDVFGWFVNIEIRRAHECGLLYSVGKDLALQYTSSITTVFTMMSNSLNITTQPPPGSAETTQYSLMIS